jgi:cobalt-zinc-cadmium efflux system membrane fusion protein
LITYDNVELGVWINDYRSALAAKEGAEAEVEVTRRALERAEKLVAIGAVAASEVERRQADYKRAVASIGNHTATITAAEEKIRRAGVSPESVRVESNAAPSTRVVVSAPFDGVVTGFDVTPGEIVETGEDLLTLTDLSTVWVQANVNQRDVAAIREGQRVRVWIDSYPNKAFGGTITYIGDALDPETRTVQVRCEVANPRRELKLDMFARIQIATSGTAQRLVVASEAVQLIEDKPVVFVKTGDAEFHQRDVQLGAQGDDWVEIREGVAEGEPVVVKGAFTLKSALLKEQIGGGDHH